MIDIGAWGAVLAGLAGTVAARVNVGRLIRTHLRQRTQVELERERSARVIARTAELAQVLRCLRGPVRMVERDSDGERLIEIGQAARTEKVAPK